MPDGSCNDPSPMPVGSGFQGKKKVIAINNFVKENVSRLMLLCDEVLFKQTYKYQK